MLLGLLAERRSHTQTCAPARPPFAPVAPSGSSTSGVRIVVAGSFSPLAYRSSTYGPISLGSVQRQGGRGYGGKGGRQAGYGKDCGGAEGHKGSTEHLSPLLLLLMLLLMLMKVVKAY